MEFPQHLSRIRSPVPDKNVSILDKSRRCSKMASQLIERIRMDNAGASLRADQARSMLNHRPLSERACSYCVILTCSRLTLRGPIKTTNRGTQGAWSAFFRLAWPTDPEYDKSVKWLWRSAHGGDSCSFPVDTLTVLPCPDWLIRCGVGEQARGGPQKFAALRWSPQPFYILIVLRVCRSYLFCSFEQQFLWETF